MGLDFNKDYNLFTFVLLFGTLIGVFWLAVNDVKAGWVYFMLSLFTLSVILYIVAFLREEKEEYHLNIPIETSSLRAFAKFVMGAMIPLIMAMAFPAVLHMMNPMMTFNLGSGGTSYSAIEKMDQPFWQMFTIGPTAAVQEEFWSLGMWLGGMVIGYYISRRLGIENRIATLIFQVIVAVLITVIMFTVLHTLNPTYNSRGMFISAMLFRLIMSFVMYFIFGIEFTIGYHLLNNLVYLGWGVVWPGLLTTGGMILIVILLLEIFNFIRQWKNSENAVSEIFNPAILPQHHGGP